MPKINPNTGGEEWSPGHWVCLGITVVLLGGIGLLKWLGVIT